MHYVTLIWVASMFRVDLTPILPEEISHYELRVTNDDVIYGPYHMSASSVSVPVSDIKLCWQARVVLTDESHSEYSPFTCLQSYVGD